MTPKNILQESLRRNPDGSVSLFIKIKPGAKKQGFQIQDGGGLVLFVRKRAQEGAANQAVIEFVSSCLGIAKSRVILVRGQMAKHKELRLQGVDADDVSRKIEVHLL